MAYASTESFDCENGANFDGRSMKLSGPIALSRKNGVDDAHHRITAASASGSKPSSRKVAEVTGLMLTIFVLRKSSPSIFTTDRAIAELVTVTQSIFPPFNAATISASAAETSVLKYTTICSTVAPAAFNVSAKTSRPRLARANKNLFPLAFFVNNSAKASAR